MRRKASQLSFDRYLPRHQRRHIAYGGTDSEGERKIRRPLHPKYPVHLVLKSSLAKGQKSFLEPKNARFIAAELQRWSKKHGLSVLEWENVGNHLHLVLRFKDPKSVGRFLKVFCARISMRWLETKKGRSGVDVLRGTHEKNASREKEAAGARSSEVAHPERTRFWDATPFSRIVFERLREGFGLVRYLRKNHFESLGWDRGTALLLAKNLPPDISWGPPPV